MSGPSARRVIIVGGSISGLFAGLLLRRAGWDVDIYERVAGELSGRGAGIVVQPQFIEQLRGIGLDPRQLGVDVATRQLLDTNGVVTATHSCPQIMTAWERVFRFLRDAFPSDRYHRGIALVEFATRGHGVSARFSDGKEAHADLLIGADGIRSGVRQTCLPDLAPQYAGYIAWRGMIAECDIPAATHTALFAFMSYGLPPGEQFLGYPVAGADNDLRPGHRRYNVVWYRPAKDSTELADLLTDETGKLHSVSIPPPLIRSQAIAGMRAAAERLLAPQFRDIVKLIGDPLLQPIYDLETPRMAFGRVAIIGDAAFVARPHVAAGVAKAAADAAALVRALSSCEVIEAALQQFETERLPINRRYIERARHLGAYLQAEQTVVERTHSQRHSIPDAVLAETAVMDF